MFLNRVALQQLFVNLIVNAIESMMQNGKAPRHLAVAYFFLARSMRIAQLLITLAAIVPLQCVLPTVRG